MTLHVVDSTRLAFCHSGGSATTSQPTWSIAWSQQPCVLFFLASRKPSTYTASWQPQALEEALGQPHARQHVSEVAFNGWHTRDFLPLLLFWEGTPRGCWCWTCTSSSPKRNGRCACIATLHQLSCLIPSHALCEPGMPEPSATPLVARRRKCRLRSTQPSCMHRSAR